MKLLLVCSSGGHLLQMTRLRHAWERYERAWVTFDAIDSRTLLAGERVHYAHGPSYRNVPNLMRNLRLALRVLPQEAPDCVISTGGGVAAPFLWLAAMRGIATVHCDSITYSEHISLTSKLVAPFVDHRLVQWEELAARTRGVEYWGSVM